MKNRITVAIAAALALSTLAFTVTVASTNPSAPVSETEQPVQAQIQEDDPNWDCRINGNQKCGVQIQGVWYVVDFATMTAVLR